MHFASLAQLIRLPLALMVALTAVAGALAVRAPLPGQLLWDLGSGVFLLAAASSVLNQVQERATDALLQRTAGRPLASGVLTPGSGTAIGLLLGSGGLAQLTAGTGTGPAARSRSRPRIAELALIHFGCVIPGGLNCLGILVACNQSSVVFEHEILDAFGQAVFPG